MKDRRATYSAAQRARLARYQVGACIDLHCHCLPGLDDGPETMADALRLCAALVADGITTVVATPHQLGRYDSANSSAVVRKAVAVLNEQLHQAQVPLCVLPGGDIRIDERLPQFINDDHVTTLADRRSALLLELPHELYVNPGSILTHCAASGIAVVLTHPERHWYLRKNPSLVMEMVGQGALLQITAGSLLGEFGPAAQDCAWRWIREGAVTAVATDAHDTEHRPPRMTAAIEAIEQALGGGVAKQLCMSNPERILFSADRDFAHCGMLEMAVESSIC